MAASILINNHFYSLVPFIVAYSVSEVSTRYMQKKKQKIHREMMMWCSMRHFPYEITEVSRAIRGGARFYAKTIILNDSYTD